MLARNEFDKTRWSDKFLPTPGKSTRGLIPTVSSSVAFPIPELKRTIGVPTEPAERMSSLDAVRLLRGPWMFHVQEIAYITWNEAHLREKARILLRGR